MNVILKLLTKGCNRGFRLLQDLPMAGEFFDQFLQIGNQKGHALENFRIGKKFSRCKCQKSPLKQLKLAHKKIDVADQPNKDLCTSVAVQCRHARCFICSGRTVCRKQRQNVQANCLSYLKTWWVCMSTWYNEFRLKEKFCRLTRLQNLWKNLQLFTFDKLSFGSSQEELKHWR